MFLSSIRFWDLRELSTFDPRICQGPLLAFVSRILCILDTTDVVGMEVVGGVEGVGCEDTLQVAVDSIHPEKRNALDRRYQVYTRRKDSMTPRSDTVILCGSCIRNLWIVIFRVSRGGHRNHSLYVDFESSVHLDISRANLIGKHYAATY